MHRIGKIDIIGVNYTLYVYDDYKLINQHAKERHERYFPPEEETRLDGYCDYQAKEIKVFKDEYTSNDYFESVLRHELCHAFLFEIGYAHHDDEEFIEKLSKWIPQINKIFDFSIAAIKMKEVTEKITHKEKEESDS